VTDSFERARDGDNALDVIAVQPQRPEARRLLTKCFPFGERLARAAKQIRSTSASTTRFALVLEVRGGRFSSGAGAAASSLDMAAWIAHAATGLRGCVYRKLKLGVVVMKSAQDGK
jgi:hypothetical protein